MAEDSRPKVHFCTFGDVPKYNKALAIIKKEAEESEYFDTIDIYTQENLPSSPEETEFISKNPRGYGYWLWKYIIIHDMMGKYPEGDVIVYTDAGCGISTTPAARKEMDKWITKCISHPTHRISYLLGFPEHEWTKSDIFAYFNVLDKPEITSTGQFIAGIQIYLNNEDNRIFINKYKEAASHNNFHNITDAPSAIPNHIKFQENRHDQSILSVMFKIYGSCNVGYNYGQPQHPIMILRRRHG
jgi:hypothetical protein